MEREVWVVTGVGMMGARGAARFSLKHVENKSDAAAGDGGTYVRVREIDVTLLTQRRI